MKTRLLCLALCLTMLLSLCLTACGPTEESDEIITLSTSTIVMALVTEDGTTDKAVQEIEDAINDVTKGEFGIQIKLEVYSMDEYYDAIEKKLVASELSAENVATAKAEYDKFKKANRPNIKDNRVMVEKFLEQHPEHPEWKDIVETYVFGMTSLTPDDLTYVDDNGRVQDVYPELVKDQIDIFYLGDYNKLLEYVENGWLANLSGQTTALNTYIPSIFADGTKVGGSSYAVAGNTCLGEYTYLLVNKEMSKKYLLSETYFSDKNITSVSDDAFQKFLADVKAYESGEFDVLKSDSKSEMNLVKYWGVDTETYELLNDFSVIGSVMDDKTTGSTVLGFENLFENESYVNQLLALKSFEYNGYYAEENSEKKFAAAVLSGDKTLAIDYADKYDVIVLAKPIAGEKDLFSNMFAINKNSTNSVEKCLQIITLFTTDIKARNLLLYGIEGVNYAVNKNGEIVRKEDNEYFMDVYKTGNVLLAYREEGMPANIWELVIEQNMDAIIDPTMGFGVTEESELDVELTNEVRAISAHCLEEINKCKTLEDLEACIDLLRAELALSEAVARSIGGTVSKPEDEGTEEGEGTTAPETTAPETTAPETTAPETTAPETTAPETTAPDEDAVPVFKTLYEIYVAWASKK